MTSALAFLKEALSNKDSKNNEENQIVRPGFFRLVNQADSDMLSGLLSDKPHIKIFDTIDSQLSELIKSAHPARTFTDAELAEAVKQHLGGKDTGEYGVWVYYPWNEKLVHILDEDEFIELRTNRNKYKITDQEESRLASKKIGVIGLSVGQSVSLTLAMERTFGELRIADFDELEITNLNRLRSGIHNMGIKKTVLVAREIAEIDPFLNVTCFHEGITDENMEDFLLTGGRLDVLIDECDSVDIKIKCRIAAKYHHIPVLMEASDRATIDVERFDLEPDRPILHGFVDHLDISKVRGLKTMEEKLPYILPIVGIETMSARLKASAVEIGQSISTWPQLASAVTMGGGITADVCRRVLLDQFHQSGRYFVDIDELIGDPQEDQASFDHDVKPLTDEQIKAAAASVKPLGNNSDSVKDESVINTLVQAALLAPSAGNNQPWKWYFNEGQLFLFHERSRSVSFGDFDNMASNLAFGAAIENLILKAGELNLEVEKRLFPSESEKSLVAVFQFTKKPEAQKDPLANYMTVRYTNRFPGKGGDLGTSVVNEMYESVRSFEGVQLRIIQDEPGIKKLAEITGTSEKLRLFIPEGHYDLFEKELRWTPESTGETKDGLDIRTLELSAKDAVGMSVIRDPKAIELVAAWNGGKALENMTGNLVGTSSAVGLISMPEFNPVSCILAGRAVERVWLTATKHGIAVQPVLAPIFHFIRINHGGGEGIPAGIQKEFKKLNEELNIVFDLTPSEEPLFLFRLCFADVPQLRSLRLDFDEVFIS